MKLSQPDSELSPLFSTFFSKAAEEFTYNESNDSPKEALAYFENHRSIENIKKRTLTRVIKLIKTSNIN